jgi:hypothetical protein
VTLLDADLAREEPAQRASRAAFLLGGVGVTGILVYFALGLGAWGFDYRRYSQHNGRLARLLAKQPQLAQVVAGLQDEGSRLVAAPEGETSLQVEAARSGGAKAGEVLEKGRRWPRTRVFLAGDMIYFIYFDEAGRMRDFTCVSR